MKLAIKKASTDVTVYLFIQDSSATTGAGLTGLTFETASLVASYVRPLAARAALTLATQTVTGAHSDGGFVEVDATNMPGVYRLDLPDAVCATGVPSVVVMLKGAANMAPLLLEIQLTDFDLNDASPNVTVADIANDAITAAAYDESTAFPVKSADTGATAIARVGADSDTLETLSDEIAAVKAETALIVADTGTDGVVLKAAGLATDAVNEIVDQVWNELVNDHTATGSFGQMAGGRQVTFIPTQHIKYGEEAKVIVMAIAHNGDLTFSDNLVFSGGFQNSVCGFYTDTGAMVVTTDVVKLADGIYTATFSASQTQFNTAMLFLISMTASYRIYYLRLSTIVAPANEYDTDIAAIQADLDNPNQYKADVSGLATQTSVNAIPTTPLLAANYVAPDNVTIGEIKAKTDLIPAIPAQAGEYTAAIAAIPTTGLTAQQVWEYVTRELTSSSGGGATAQEVWEYATRVLTAGTNIDLSALATAADLAALDGKVDTVDGILDDLHGTDIPAIKAKTDVIPASPAAAGEYTAAIAAVQADLDNPAQYKADVSGIPAAVWGYATRTLSSFGSLIADIWSHVTRTLSSFGFTVATNSDANVTAIKAKTDNLPANTATALAAVQADLDNPAQYKADVSGLATATDLATVDGIVDAIKAKTDTIPATPAQAGEYTAAIAAIPTSPLLAANYVAPDNASIGAIKTKTDQLVFTTPNKVDATATVDPTGIATSDELEIIGEKVDGVLNKLNVSSVEFVTAVVGTTITILRGDTLSARLLDLGDLTQYASLDFTVKRVAGELDDAAKIRLRKNASGADDGLLRLNGAEHTSLTDGSIVIDDTTTGDIEIKLNAAATQELVPGNYVYDVQLITSNNVKTLTAGKLKVDADVTRATV